MKTITQYYCGFFLLSDAENCKIVPINNALWVAPLKQVFQYESIQIDYNHVAFAEKNQKGDIEYFHGLESLLRIKKVGFPSIFICDNHNHALSFWYQIVCDKLMLGQNITLLHIDQHSDCRENKNNFQIDDSIDSICEFANYKCNVGNFINPAINSGLISNQIQIRSVESLKNVSVQQNEKYILDIDLDFCLSGINRMKIDEDKLKLLKLKFDEIAQNALGITIATSPYFLDQNIAKDILDYLLGN